MTNITPYQLELAREWARYGKPGHQPETVAAAEVISSLPDGWVNADKLREVIEGWRTTTNQTMHRVDKTYKSAAADLEALLPSAKPRTLADMTEDEREACQWAQADFDNGFADPPIRVVITVIHPNVANIILPSGVINCVVHDSLTPLPDLPRMVWPDEHWLPSDEEQAAEETPTPPRPEDVPEGEFWLVEFDGQQCAAERDLPGTEYPWWLMRGYRVSDKGITLVTRLVTEVKA